jgi:hypothetical protein
LIVRFDEATRPQLLIALRSLLTERDDLQRKVSELEYENQRISQESATFERENATLSYLQVASRLLHRSLDRKQVVTAIEEVVVNLIGCEQVALFDYEVRGKQLALISSFGIDQEKYKTLPIGDGPIGDCVRTGEIQLSVDADGGQPDGAPTACVPLKLENRVVGVLVLFKLLIHKTGLEDTDLALFDLISQQGGVALVSTYPTGVRSWR